MELRSLKVDEDRLTDDYGTISGSQRPLATPTTTTSDDTARILSHDLLAVSRALPEYSITRCAVLLLLPET